MRSYPLHIGGVPCEGSGWTYVVKVDELIRDPRGAFRVRRALELGETVDPAQTGIVAGRCAVGDDADNLRALEAAAAASKAFARIPAQTRKQMGVAFHERLSERATELVEVLIAEGHPRRVAERETDGMLHGCSAEHLDWLFAQMTQRFEEDDRSVLLTRKPDGVVCINPPQNAPTANAAFAMLALLAGNTIVVKAPKTAPLGVMYLFHEVAWPAFAAYGAPPGTMNLVCGYSKQILRTWVESPLADDIVFFGDSRVGMRFSHDCTARGRKPILELSGNDAFVVWRDADLERAAAMLTESFYGSSQICMVPKQAVLHPAIADEFIALFLAAVAQVRPAYLDEPGALLSPVLKMDRFFDCLSQAREQGAELLCGGARVGVDGAPATDGLFLEPTVVRVDGLARARELSCVAEETFFPLLPLIVADDAGDDGELAERIVDWCNASPYGLRNSIWASDPAVVDGFAEGLRNGGLLKINDSHLGVARHLATHGGTGLSGGPFGELHYPMLRTSHLQGITFGRLPAEPREPAPSADAGRLLAGKRLLVTGVITHRSIAWAVARALQRHGAELMLTSFGRIRRLTERAAAGLDRPVEVLELDASEPAEFRRLQAAVRERWGTLDGALHAIAFAPPDAIGGAFLQTPPGSAELAFRISAFSLKELAAALTPLMPDGGSIVSLDFDATRAWPDYDWMGVAKAALGAVSRYLTLELGPRGIRVNVVSCGPFKTVAASALSDFDELADMWHRRAPLGWDPRRTDVAAGPVTFLLSDLSAGVSGEILHVDGGFHAIGAARGVHR